jgi:hypothetical protein
MSTVCGEVTYLDGRPGAKAVRPPVEIRVIQAEYKHEIAVLTYIYDGALKERCERGLPVLIRYGYNDAPADLYGSVHHVVVDRQESSAQTRYMRVVIVGATDPLNAPAANLYRNIRVDAMVSDLVRRFGYSALVEKHNYPWPVLQQAYTSTWAFLVAAAQKIGYTLYARNTDIRCHSRAIRYGGAIGYREAGAAQSEGARHVVHSFELVQGETLAQGARKRRRIAYGVNDRDEPFHTVVAGQIDQSGLAVTPTALDQYYLTSARSIAEAEAEMAAEQERNRHYIEARARVGGHAGLHPARAVRLVGLDAQNNGFWFTTRAEHVMDQKSYRVDLRIGRDSYGDVGNLDVPPADPRATSNRVVVHNGLSTRTTFGNINRDAPPTRWDDTHGRWRAVAMVERILPPPNRRAPDTLEAVNA